MPLIVHRTSRLPRQRRCCIRTDSVAGNNQMKTTAPISAPTNAYGRPATARAIPTPTSVARKYMRQKQKVSLVASIVKQKQIADRSANRIPQYTRAPAFDSGFAGLLLCARVPARSASSRTAKAASRIENRRSCCPCSSLISPSVPSTIRMRPAN